MAKSKKPAPVARKHQPEVHDVADDYVSDALYDEEQIMAERGRAPKVFDSSSLRKPISTIVYHKPVTVKPTSTIADAVSVMQKGHFGCVLVVDKGKPIGIFTERDVLFKLAGKGKDWKKAKIADYMT